MVRTSTVAVKRINVVKYDLIRPLFVEDVKLIMGRLIVGIDFGPIFSYQIKSFMCVAMFCPIVIVVLGLSRCMIILKNPSWLEKFTVLLCFGVRRVVVLVASSKAYKRPKIVTRIAESFVIGDIVIAVVFSGIIVEVINRPAATLPVARRMIGLVKVLSSSEIHSVGAIREVPACT